MTDGTSGRRRPISILAVVALVSGIVWVFGLASLLAVFAGHLALRRIRKQDQRGRWPALAGLVLGYLGLLLVIVLLLQGGVDIADNVPE